VTLGWEALVGRYRLELTNELRAFIERSFVASAPAAEQAALRRAALEEAATAELELYPDRTLVSRSGKTEFVRVHLGDADVDERGFVFEKAPAVSVRVELCDFDTLVARQTGKPPAVFRRTR
jgi:hypothetical protein